MMTVMPPSFWFCKSKFFDKNLFAFEVFNHFFNGNMIICNGRCFAITLPAQMLQFQNKCGLMCFCSPGNCKWVPEFKVVSSVVNFHRVKEAQYNLFCQLHHFYRYLYGAAGWTDHSLVH